MFVKRIVNNQYLVKFFCMVKSDADNIYLTNSQHAARKIKTQTIIIIGKNCIKPHNCKTTLLTAIIETIYKVVLKQDEDDRFVTTCPELQL